ncbi:2-C-methyl-D-erythritol 2,4-cyclodiphosphate synthase [bacterium]|nr:2-C-methyl-D-erythritol 2,4-cyclodiphosphate synthase [bacterium]
MIPFRIGEGIDFHKFKKGNGFKLGGVFIQSDLSIEAHSDGDILFHAIADAMLGTFALGDIGKHFPDTDSKYKNIDSSEIVLFAFKEIQKKGYYIGNIDATIILQKPKIAPYIEAIRYHIADLFGINTDQISIKATTSEKMGFVGREEGIAVFATVLISNLKQYK